MSRRDRAKRLGSKHDTESRPTIATDGGAEAVERGGAIDADGSGSGAAKASRRGVLKAGAAAAGLAGGVAGAARNAKAGVINNLAGVQGPVAPGNGVGRLLPSNGTYLGDTFNLAGGQYTLAVGLTSNGQATVTLGTGISYTDTTTGVQPGGINWLSGVSELGGGLFNQPITQIGGSVSQTAGSKVLSARFVEQNGNMVVKARGVSGTTSPPATSSGTTVTGPSGTFTANAALSGQHRSYTATLSINSGTWESMKIYDGQGNTLAGPGTGSTGYSVRFESTNIDSFANSPSVSFYAHAKTVDTQANIGGSLYGSPATAVTFGGQTTSPTPPGTNIYTSAQISETLKIYTVTGSVTSGSFSYINLRLNGGNTISKSSVSTGATLQFQATGQSLDSPTFTFDGTPTALGTGTTIDLGRTSDQTTNTGVRFGSLGKLTLTESVSTYSLTAEVNGGTITSAKIQTYQQGSTLTSTQQLTSGQTLTYQRSNYNLNSETWRALGTVTNFAGGPGGKAKFDSTTAKAAVAGGTGNYISDSSAKTVNLNPTDTTITALGLYANADYTGTIDPVATENAYLYTSQGSTKTLTAANYANGSTKTTNVPDVTTNETGTLKAYARAALSSGSATATAIAYALQQSGKATLSLQGSAQTPGKAGLSLYGSAYTI